MTIAAPGHDGKPVIIAQTRHIDATATAPKLDHPAYGGPHPDFNIEEHLLDHAGAYYEWFRDADVDAEGNLVIWVSADAVEYAGDVDPKTGKKVFTPAEVWTVLLATLAEFTAAGWDADDYEYRYLEDTLAGRFDDADGDMNVIDGLLQRLAFGELVYG